MRRILISNKRFKDINLIYISIDWKTQYLFMFDYDLILLIFFMNVMTWKIHLKYKYLYFSQFLYFYWFNFIKIIIKLIITSSRYDLSLTLVQPLKSWTSPFYDSLYGLGFKTMSINDNVIDNLYPLGVTNLIWSLKTLSLLQYMSLV